MKVGLYIVCTLLFLSFNSYGSNVEEILRKAQAAMDSKHIACETKYDLFKGHTGNEITESYKGFIYRNNEQQYQRIDQTEFIFAKDFFLKVNHKEKAVVLDLPQETMVQNVDLKTILDNCYEKSVVEKSTYYSLTFRYNSTTGMPCGVIKMRIEKSSYQLLQMDLYYRGLQNFSGDWRNKDMERPRLRIRFEQLDKTPKDMSELFAFETYLKTENSIHSLTGKCTGYELIDNRVK